PTLMPAYAYAILPRLCLFVFQSAPPHPDLPSFPTRRSSDLNKRSRRANRRRGIGSAAPPFIACNGLLCHTCRAGIIPKSRALTRDRKSTRLNSSHEWISYAVFCLKKKKNV